ncbi:MAG: hypothetical protein D6686_02640 [Alphaproteobacteria bacterium]|nr:MAG: hypothetical protein D6686_02640 [Alphaproteobacteria bacterium]
MADPVRGTARAALRARERERARARRAEIARWQNRLALWKGERDRILAEAKKGKGEKRAAVDADPDALGPEPAAPVAGTPPFAGGGWRR